ncbi:hypothetical protein NX059_001561 [Plenodomus lindquistii]|nr:hypothetical protein NX059_001561 [Plenodomus lindquistii]
MLELNYDSRTQPSLEDMITEYFRPYNIKQFCRTCRHTRWTRVHRSIEAVPQVLRISVNIHRNKGRWKQSDPFTIPETLQLGQYQNFDELPVSYTLSSSIAHGGLGHAGEMKTARDLRDEDERPEREREQAREQRARERQEEIERLRLEERRHDIEVAIEELFEEERQRLREQALEDDDDGIRSQPVSEGMEDFDGLGEVTEQQLQEELGLEDLDEMGEQPEQLSRVMDIDGDMKMHDLEEDDSDDSDDGGDKTTCVFRAYSGESRLDRIKLRSPPLSKPRSIPIFLPRPTGDSDEEIEEDYIEPLFSDSILTEAENPDIRLFFRRRFDGSRVPPELWPLQDYIDAATRYERYIGVEDMEDDDYETIRTAVVIINGGRPRLLRTNDARAMYNPNVDGNYLIDWRVVTDVFHIDGEEEVIEDDWGGFIVVRNQAPGRNGGHVVPLQRRNTAAEDAQFDRLYAEEEEYENLRRRSTIRREAREEAAENRRRVARNEAVENRRREAREDRRRRRNITLTIPHRFDSETAMESLSPLYDAATRIESYYGVDDETDEDGLARVATVVVIVNGGEPRVVFNSNPVFEPNAIELDWESVTEIIYIDGEAHEVADVDGVQQLVEEQGDATVVTNRGTRRDNWNFVPLPHRGIFGQEQFFPELPSDHGSELERNPRRDGDHWVLPIRIRYDHALAPRRFEPWHDAATRVEVRGGVNQFRTVAVVYNGLEELAFMLYNNDPTVDNLRVDLNRATEIIHLNGTIDLTEDQEYFELTVPRPRRGATYVNMVDRGPENELLDYEEPTHLEFTINGINDPADGPGRRHRHLASIRRQLADLFDHARYVNHRMPPERDEEFRIHDHDLRFTTVVIMNDRDEGIVVYTTHPLNAVGQPPQMDTTTDLIEIDGEVRNLDMIPHRDENGREVPDAAVVTFAIEFRNPPRRNFTLTVEEREIRGPPIYSSPHANVPVYSSPPHYMPPRRSPAASPPGGASPVGPHESSSPLPVRDPIPGPHSVSLSSSSSRPRSRPRSRSPSSPHLPSSPPVFPPLSPIPSRTPSPIPTETDTIYSSNSDSDSDSDEDNWSHYIAATRGHAPNGRRGRVAPAAPQFHHIADAHYTPIAHADLMANPHVIPPADACPAPDEGHYMVVILTYTRDKLRGRAGKLERMIVDEFE